MNKQNLIILCLLWIGTSLHAGVEVIARFEPSRIAVGSNSKYIVEVTDSDTNALTSAERIDSIPLPAVDGIVLRNGRTSTSQQTQIINGLAKYSVTQQIIIDTIPSSTGTYTIPSYSFEYKGARHQVPAATLTVVERSADATPTKNELIFLTLDPPERLYVGQIKQATLKLYIANNVRLGDYVIEPDADGFITKGGPPEKPIEGTEIVNGRRYQVYSWLLSITPISSGKQDLNFQSTLIAQLPTSRSTRSSPFGQSIFDDLFGRTERINIYTKPTQVDVLPLPKEGQPENFSGAIGQFNISVSTDNKSTRVSEPIMLSLKLSGQGNFSRIQGPEMAAAEGWRSYPPESAFEANAIKKLRGTKRFDYIFVPEKTGTLELPEVNFSFFDPTVKKYVELSSPAITIEVAPSNISSTPLPSPPPQSTTSAALPAEKLVKSLTTEELLQTLDYRPKEGRRLPSSLVFTSRFYWINGGFFTIVCATFILTYRRRYLLQRPYHALLQSAKEELKVTLKKTQSSNVETFFRNAQKAIRLAATLRTKLNLRTAGLATLEEHFRQAGLNETTIDQVRTLFQTAEAHQFSGHCQTVDLSESRKQLNNVLKAL